MPNRNYINGANRERKVVNDFRKQGWLAFRSAGSHSPIDVFALDPRAKHIYLIQCKPFSMLKKNKSPNKEALELIESLKDLDGTYEVFTDVVFGKR